MRFWASRISKQVGVPWRSCLTSRRAGRERISRSCNGLPNALQARRAGLAEVWEVLNTWDISRNPERRLGDAIKVLPAQEVSRIIAALRAGLA